MTHNNQECTNCGSIGTIIEDPSTGFLTCTNCGSIQGQSLSNEAEFIELSNGSSSVKGQFITSRYQQSQGLISTASSIEGKARIRAICESLSRLENQPDVVEKAERLFKRALHERFIRGRTVEIVCGACVYIAIRQKRTTGYLLVDVADHVSCGFFELAATSIQLARRFKENMPLTDPTLYVDRFTEELKFGRKSDEIKETAIQLIRRMDRDWIQSGRKPSGVCGAAIMMSAARHGVKVPEDKIFKCARVCLTTINKRLKEVAKTEFAKLSFSEIEKNPDLIEGESQEKPPSMQVKERLENIAAEIEKESSPQKVDHTKEEMLNETFDDDDLKDVDDMVLDEEEAETRAALFYALYKSKLNQEPKIEKIKKKEKQTKSDNDDDDENNSDNNNNNNNNEGDDDGFGSIDKGGNASDADENDAVSGDDNFDDF